MSTVTKPNAYSSNAPRSLGKDRVDSCSIFLAAIRESKVLSEVIKKELELFILKEMAYASSNGVGKYYTRLLPDVPNVESEKSVSNY